MLLLEADNAESYLRGLGRLEPGERVRIESLPGGVSNQVLYVTRLDRPGEDFVLKQSREQLRVPDPWHSRLDRIWREVDVMKVCQRALANSSGASATAARGELAAVTPDILFEDRADFAFGMSAAPRAHTMWKQQLLAGEANPQIAAACGRLLGVLHAGTWHAADAQRELADVAIFDELRIDPYYRQVARVHADLTPNIERLIDTMTAERHALVHADFSPKNLLVWPGGLMMVDFETGHYGDPAFDLGFFLTHLTLKTLHAPVGREAEYQALAERFWQAYEPIVASVAGAAYAPLARRGLLHLGGCLLARVDGKSRVEYLKSDVIRERVRRLGRSLLVEPATEWGDVTARLLRRE